MSFLKKIQKFLNWTPTSKPEISLDSDLYEQLKPFRFPLIAVVLMMLVGAIGYMIFSNFSLIDGIYQAGMTFTTLGYTEVAEITTAGRLFTITYVLMGFLTFTFSIGLVIEVLKKGVLVRILKERRMIYKIARLKNHFVICYHNEFTIELTRQFRENHIPFVVVDEDRNLDKIAEKYKYPYYINEAPHTNIAFLKTHLSSARGIITLSKNSADNIAIIASTRLFEKEIGRISPYFIMTSSENEDDAQKLKKLGANSVVSSVKLVAQRMTAVSVRPDMENLLEQFLYKKDSPIDIEEIKVPAESWMRFKRLKDIDFRGTINVSIIGIKDQNKFIPMPNGEVLIGSDCRLLLIGAVKDIKEARVIIKSKTIPKIMQKYN